MLVLSRRINERIMVGDDIVITVVDVRGDKCRLGISAPDDVKVDREEVRRKIVAKNSDGVGYDDRL